MRIAAFSALALGFGLVSVQLSACSNSADDCNATATCGATSGASSAGSAGKSGSGNEVGGDGGAAASGGSQNTSGTMGASGEGGGSNGCSGDVSEDPTCWATNELGVFVSSEHGSDATGDGSKENPYASITKGIANATGKNVYVCLGIKNDEYNEQLLIDGSSTDGLRIYGGFACDDWSYSTGRKALVHPTQPAIPIALRILGTKKGVYIENMRFQAADGVDDPQDDKHWGMSSYGAFVTSSKNVVLKAVDLIAGAGKGGSKGDDGTKGMDGSKSGTAPVGTDAMCPPFDPPVPTISGGVWATDNCGSQGGPGGAALKNTANGASGGAGSPTLHVSPQSDIENGGSGETAVITNLDGKIGTQGDPGTNGVAASTEGTFSANGFQLASGKAGTPGWAGQGGGGGGASKGNGTCYGASGGAGGMGGCGGTQGLGGGGGGASVGMVSWQSEVSLQACTVQAGVGGAGGPGGKGGAAGVGDVGGGGGKSFNDGVNVIKRGGTGGAGGDGGPGGSGSGGSGGPSIALVFSGTKPVADAATSLATGTPGAGGLGGKAASQAPKGNDGAAEDELEVK